MVPKVYISISNINFITKTLILGRSIRDMCLVALVVVIPTLIQQILG